MKSEDTTRAFPKRPEDWERLIAEAPGPDGPLSPEEEKAFWDKAVLVRKGGPKEIRRALLEKRRLREKQSQK